MKRLNRKILRSSRGLGLTEVLIASAMVVFVAVVLAFIISNTKKTTKTTEGTSACRIRAQAMVDIFKNADNKLQIGNFHSLGAVPIPTPPYPHPERFLKPLANPTPGANMTYDQTNGWELINSGSNWALALYNSTSAGSNFCSTPFVASSANQLTVGSAPGGFSAWGPPNPIYPSGALLTSEKVYLNIQRYDYATGSATCLNQGSQRLVPQGSANASSPDTTLGVNIGLQITGSIQFVDVDGTPQGCTASTLVKPEGDLVAPVFTAVPMDVMPGSACPPMNCFCNGNNICVSNVFPGKLITSIPNQYCGTAKVTVSAAVGEPGSVFGCELDYSAALAGLRLNPIPLFKSCANFSTSGVTGTISAIHVAADNTTGVEIDMTGLADGYYNIFVEAFDSAQNPQIQNSIFQYTALCP